MVRESSQTGSDGPKESLVSERSGASNTSWSSTASIPMAIAMGVAGAVVVLVMSAGRLMMSQKGKKSGQVFVEDDTEVDKEEGASSGPPVAVPASPSRQGQSQIDSKNLLTRQILADPNFQIPTKSVVPEDPVEKRVSEMFKKAMWDMVKTDVEKGNYDRLLQLVAELKARLKSVTPRRADLAAEIDRALDIALLRQQLSQPDFRTEKWNIHPLCDFVVQRVRFLEAPARNEETDAFWTEFEPKVLSGSVPRVDLLKEFFDFVHHKLDLIAVDTTNAYIRHIAPTVTQHGVEMSQRNFEERLKDGRVTLDCARRWAMYIQNHVARAAAAASENKEHGLSGANGVDFAKLSLQETHRVGVIELVLPGGTFGLDARGDSEEPGVVYNGGFVPETMIDEQTTLFGIFQQALQLWRTAYAILRIRQLVPQATPELLLELYGLLQAGAVERVDVKESNGGKMTTVTVMGVSSLARKLADTVVACVERHVPAAMNAEGSAALRELLRKAFNPKRVRKEPTYQLVAKRLRAIIYGLTVPQSEAMRRQNTMALPNALRAMQLGPLGSNIIELATNIYNFGERDFCIHSKTYADILTRKTIQGSAP